MMKPTLQPKNRKLLILLTAVVLLGSKCGPSGYRDPISNFQGASTVVVASTQLYVTELNKVERDHYIQGQLSERAQIKLNELEAVQVFSQDGLKARLDALDQLALYGDLLTKLANSDAPERIEAEAADHPSTGLLISTHDLAQSSGSSCSERAVEPTRAQNITVNWRRSPSRASREAPSV